MSIIYVIAGLALIIAGANTLTDGAAAIAKHFNISSLVIGLTVVAFGTSAPELTVSLLSAVKGSPDMAIGDVVGSNIFNTLLIIGCTAAIVPLTVANSSITKEIPLCLLASVALFACASDSLIDGGVSVISRGDGIMLLCFFLIFFGYVIAIAHNNSGGDGGVKVKDLSLWKAALFVAGGLAALIFGGQFFVNGASMIARSLGVSESTIGLTLVAGGTSLPELATSVVAALKRKQDMAIGNVIGSNLFNIFFILGCSATVTPMAVQGITTVDFLMLIFSCLLLFLFAVVFKKKLITRVEGVIMVTVFVAYITYLVINSQRV